MDNVTHTLFGYALGRACAARHQDEPLGRALLASAVIGSNVPDFDFVLGFFGGDARLTYLLQHRGLSHTLIFALLLGALVGSCCSLLQLKTVRFDVLALGAGTGLLHIGCDALNDYGVHPFYPFDNRWYYGDSVFIVEPLWLALLLPLPALYAWTRTGQLLSRLLALGLLGLSAFVLPVGRAAAVTVIMLATFAAQRKTGPRAEPALAGSVLLVAVFAIGSQLAEAQVRAALQRDAAAERVLDIASSPAPGDPSCHRVLAVTLDQRDVYRVHLVSSQLLGPVRWCRLLPSDPTVPLTAAETGASERVRFEATFAGPARELRALQREHCDAEALLRFARVPFWLQRDDGTVLGDIRYDRAPSLEFAERELNDVCPSLSSLAPWVPPRSDVLQP
ncbi:MAG TPA: metal-dependent hydrolase [Polyangiales bacterium]|nr:metal-dependent hydrolase [Polyangiales bacterium]